MFLTPVLLSSNSRATLDSCKYSSLRAALNCARMPTAPTGSLGSQLSQEPSHIDFHPGIPSTIEIEGTQKTESH